VEGSLVEYVFFADFLRSENYSMVLVFAEKKSGTKVLVKQLFGPLFINGRILNNGDNFL